MKVFKKTLRVLLHKPAVAIGVTWPSAFTLKWVRRYNDIQISVEELKLITEALIRKPRCKFLVFGLGNDSYFWNKLNHHGTTIFLEDNPVWFSRVKKKNPGLTAFLVDYKSHLSQAKDLLDSPSVFDLDLPIEVENSRWDIILVDAPLGIGPSAPGRMKTIAAASRLAQSRGDIFVHDCDRPVERDYSDKFLGQKNLVVEVCKLRHFNIREKINALKTPSSRQN